MKNFSSKVSSLGVSLIMGAIIIAFVLTGFQGFGTNAGQVANVDGTPITSKEFNQMLNMQIDRYTQMMGGKSLTSQQIKMFRLRESTLSNLINQKHLLNFASDLEFDAGKMHVKDEIKNYKFFETNGKFDISKYKNLLRANNISPATFEEDIVNQVKNNKLRELLESTQDSQTLVKQLLRIKNLKGKAYAISFDKESMTKNISISSGEVKKFANDKKNENLLNALYKTFESQQKAKKAKKVPTFAQKKIDLAKEHLQKTKRAELKKFNEDLISSIEKALANNSVSKLKSLKKRYGINFEEKYELSPFNNKFQSVTFNEDEVFELFKSKSTEKILKEDNPTSVGFVKMTSFEKFDPASIKEKEIEEEVKLSNQRNMRLLETEIIKYKEKNSKVVTNLQL